MSGFVDELSRRLAESNYRIDDQMAVRLAAHWELLLRWNRKINLTSIVRVEEAVVRHYCESIALARELPEGPQSVLDLGSGAGFPGLVLAVVRPECRVSLAEGDVRKAVFLEEASLDLANVSVRRERMRTAEGFDWVVARGVAMKEVRRVAGGASVGLLLSADQVAQEAEGLAAIQLPWPPGHYVAIGRSSR